MKAQIKKEIILVLANEYPRDLSIGDITKETGRARDTVKKYLKDLEENRYVEESRTVGRAKLFTVGSKIKNLVESQEGEEVSDLLQITD